MFIVFFIRNKAPLSSHMSLLKNLAYSVWRENFNFFLTFRKKISFEFQKKKNVKLEKKAVLIMKIVPFLGFRKPH